MESDAGSQQDLSPMLFKLAEDGTHAAFINQRVALHDSCGAAGNDIRLVLKQGTGIGDELRKQQGMGGSAFAADNPADVQFHQFPILFYRPGIAAIKSHPGSFAAAGAGELVELDAGNDVIIFILRKGIAGINKNRYHKYGRTGIICCGQYKGLRHSPGVCDTAGVKLWSGRLLLLFILQLHTNDNRRHSIKQSAAKCNRLIYPVPSFNLPEKSKNKSN